MAELSDLRTAVRDAVEEAQAPAFESLVRRARVRRRRRHVSLAAAALVAVAGTATLLGPGGRLAGAPSPAGQTGTVTPSATPSAAPTTARGRLQAMSLDDLVARGRLYSAGAGGGQVMAVWSVCADGSQYCRYAWRLGDRNGEVAQGDAGGGVDAPGPDVYAGAGAFVVKAWDRPGFAVRDDGTILSLTHDPMARAAREPVAVRTGGRRMALVDPVTGTTQPLPDVPGSDALDDAAVAPNGTVWALPAFAGPGKVEVTWLRDGVWHSHPIDDPGGSRMAMPGALAVSGTRTSPAHIAALSTYDGGPPGMRVGVLAVSVDDGATWTHLTKQDLPFHKVDSMAATSGGTLLLADPGGSLWRSSDATWTSFVRVTGVGPVSQLEPAGEQVLARTVAGEQALDPTAADLRDVGLVLIGDDGSTTPVNAR